MQQQQQQPGSNVCWVTNRNKFRVTGNKYHSGMTIAIVAR